MEIRELQCIKCGHPLQDDFDECKFCHTPYTPLQDVIAREHYRARLHLMNTFLRTRRKPPMTDEMILRSITITLALIAKCKVRFKEKTITEFFQNHETSIFS